MDGDLECLQSFKVTMMIDEFTKVFHDHMIERLQRQLDEMEERGVPIEEVDAFLAEYGYYRVNDESNLQD